MSTFIEHQNLAHRLTFVESAEGGIEHSDHIIRTFLYEELVHDIEQVIHGRTVDGLDGLTFSVCKCLEYELIMQAH